MATIGLEKQQVPELQEALDNSNKAKEIAQDAYTAVEGAIDNINKAIKVAEEATEAADAAREAADDAAATINEQISRIDDAVETAHKASDHADTIDTEYKEADASIIEAYQKADAEIIDNYTAADAELQSQIDALSNASDVRDVVNHYSDLVSYDKSALGDRDIIKVLKDEEHDDATSYYRFSKATGVFDYIGSVGPYYTVAEVDDKFATKEELGDIVTLLSLYVSGEGAR